VPQEGQPPAAGDADLKFLIGHSAVQEAHLLALFPEGRKWLNSAKRQYKKAAPTIQ